jgi:hypothetical protein
VFPTQSGVMMIPGGYFCEDDEGTTWMTLKDFEEQLRKGGGL